MGRLVVLVASSPAQPVSEQTYEIEQPAEVVTESVSPLTRIPSTIPVAESKTGEPEFPPYESVFVTK